MELTDIYSKITVDHRILYLVMDTAGACWVCDFKFTGGYVSELRREKRFVPIFGPITRLSIPERAEFPISEYIRKGVRFIKGNAPNAGEYNQTLAG